MKQRSNTHRVSLLLVALLALVGMAWMTTSVALADDFSCTGAVGAETKDNIFVPDNATCTLTGTIVEGNIIVGTGATLQASGVQVDGNIQAEGAASVSVNGSATVGAAIQIKQGVAATVANVKVNGDILFDENSGAIIANSNEVGGNLQAFKNTGGLAINNNQIDGNLQCKENNPAPTGSGNQAASLEDQCASLGSEGGGGDGDFKRYARIDALPASPFQGPWTIGGRQYVADSSTEFGQEYGAFAIGVCVEVEANAATPTVAKEIGTEEDYKCSGRTGDDDGDADGELYGVVTEFPADLIGKWVIGGKPFTATVQTEFHDEGGAFKNGVTVKVEFTTDSTGANYAKEIELKYANETGDDNGGSHDDDDYGDAHGAEGQAYGRLDSRGESAWVIGGIEYIVDSRTELNNDAALIVGARVKVKYTVRSDGARIAHEIEATDDDGDVSAEGHAKLVGFVQAMPAAGFVGLWKIAGQEFDAGPTATFKQDHGTFAIGAYVAVEYFMDGTTRRVHEMETNVPPGAGDDDDAGKIRGMDDQLQAAAQPASQWQIGDTAFTVTPATQLVDDGGALVVGASVVVNSYTALDGSRVATRIKSTTAFGRIFLPLLEQ